MGCISAPVIPIPSLGGGLSVGTTLPPLGTDVGLCCVQASFTTPPIPIAIGIPLNPAIFASIKLAMQTVQAWLDSLPPKCPKEL